MTLIELYDLLREVEAKPKTWNPFRLRRRNKFKKDIMTAIHEEIDLRISAMN